MSEPQPIPTPDVQVTNLPGAQTATIDTSATQAPSDPNQPLVDAGPQMPEGGSEKYWNAETGEYNWEGAYKEQAWIASQQAAPAAEAEDPAENAGETPAPAAEVTAIAAEDFNAAVMANEGTVPEEMLAAYEAKGIDPQIVQDYAATMYQKAADHIETVQQFLGGETGLALLSDHMAKNFNAEEIAAFEDQLTDPGTWRAAAMTLLQAAGLPQGGKGIIQGANAGPSATSGETFSSEAEFNAAVRDPRYKADPAFRARVEAAVRNSGSSLAIGTGVKHSL